ncbi:hypothetical protein V6Z12_D07G124000 [Gossypium hirsutum]
MLRFFRNQTNFNRKCELIANQITGLLSSLCGVSHKHKEPNRGNLGSCSENFMTFNNDNNDDEG